MAIVKTHKKENPFVIVDKTSSNDNRLSFKAKGIHMYLIGKPDDWEIYINHLAKVSTDGKDSVITGLNELFNYGYAYKEQQRGEGGKFAGWDYHIYEIPNHNPHYMKKIEDFYLKIKDIQYSHLLTKISKSIKKDNNYTVDIFEKRVLPGLEEIEAILGVLKVPPSTNVGNKPSQPKADFPNTEKPFTENPLLLNNDYILNNNYSDIKNVADENKPVLDIKEKDKKKVGRGKTSTNVSKEIYSPESNEYKLTHYLVEYISKNNPRQPVPEVNTKQFYNWIDEIDKLHRLGPIGAKDKGYSYREIKDLIDFSQTNDFWYTHILSASKLREKAVTLENQINTSKKPSPGKKNRWHYDNQRKKDEGDRNKVAENKRDEIYKGLRESKSNIEKEKIKKEIEGIKKIWGNNKSMYINRLKNDGLYHFAKEYNLI